MRTLFLLNPTAGKADCTGTLPQQINVAAARAGLAPEEYTIQVTNHGLTLPTTFWRGTEARSVSTTAATPREELTRYLLSTWA